MDKIMIDLLGSKQTDYNHVLVDQIFPRNGLKFIKRSLSSLKRFGSIFSRLDSCLPHLS